MSFIGNTSSRRGAVGCLAVFAVFTLLAGACQNSVIAAEGGVLGVKKESAGAATVAMTPKKFADGQLVVDIQVNTHTVNDLDKYDLTKIVSLEAPGQKVAPKSAPKLRGHHTSGQLVFPLASLPKAFAIKIQGLDQPAERVLSWP
jgi:hypothetical protein